ncbi:PqiC family protein [Rhizosaccharibacter radicis]|uniref:PqiC family protein n=1 Tax=Rhizosaccharibacter radicis TaxID=2782605 RepID=A0ABT1W4L2_9PROT|nr:PqiC family protein [Acetobacteraceae bacterium KSS12]
MSGAMIRRPIRNTGERRPPPPLRRRIAPLLLLVSAGACAAPPLRTFILTGSGTDAVDTGPRAAADRPMLLLRPVDLPDHLDTRDMLVRVGPNQLRSSRTGRWGDRLSVGVTDVLAEDLQALLPGLNVSTLAPAGKGFRRLSLEMPHFELDDAGTLRLQARWHLDGSDAGAVRRLGGGEIALRQDAVPAGDAAEAAAMSEMLRRLAEALVPGIAGSGSGAS